MPIDVVAWTQPPERRAGTTLVVALHGRGSDGPAIAGIAPLLPDGITVAAPRGPILADGGFAWYRAHAVGQPSAASLETIVTDLLAWLDDVAGVHEQVIVLGFSGGATTAAALVLTDPTRFSGAVLLSGAIPLDAGLDVSDGRLAGVNVFWANDPDDPVITRSLVDRSETWLRTRSGATLTERFYPDTGHSITPTQTQDIHTFIASMMG